MMRHGPTAWTAERRLQGRTETALSAEGRAAVSSWRLPRQIANFAWVTSPLARVRETAALLGHADAPVDERLAEMSFGDWEGRRLSDLRAEFGTAMAALEGRGLDFRAPGGESPRDVQQRLESFLLEVGRGDRDLIVVTHKSVIRSLYALATGWPMLGRSPDRLAEFALHLFAVDTEGKPSVHRLNLPLEAAGREAG